MEPRSQTLEDRTWSRKTVEPLDHRLRTNAGGSETEEKTRKYGDDADRSELSHQSNDEPRAPTCTKTAHVTRNVCYKAARLRSWIRLDGDWLLWSSRPAWLEHVS